MVEQKMLAARITSLCEHQGISYYRLSYNSTVPLTTVMNIVNCETKNPGIFTVIKLCDGLGITVKDFFDSPEFIGIESEAE